VGIGERIIIWSRRNPRIAGLLAALLLVFLAGSGGVLWQWQRASNNAAKAAKNAAAYRQEWEIARQQKERAQHHLKLVRDGVGKLEQLGQEMLQKPGQYRSGQAVLEKALAFYKELLPEEGYDPEVRREAVKLFGQVAWIQHTLGQADKAAAAWDDQAELLDSLLKENPGDNSLRLDLAHSKRWRGNMLRDLGRTRQARKAYDRAAELQKALHEDYPNEPEYQMALANTLINTASLLSYCHDQTEELGALYRRIVELDRAAVGVASANPQYRAELALALADDGRFLLETGRSSGAEIELREALQIYQKLLDGGHMKGYVERYMARNLVTLGRVLAVSGQPHEAEQTHLKAVRLLEQSVKEFPNSAHSRADLASALATLADLLKDLGRGQEAEILRRRVIREYEKLKVDFSGDLQHERSLVPSYLQLARLLWELGRATEAAEMRRKALEVAAEDPAVNNDLAWFLATNPEPFMRDLALAVRLAKKAVDVHSQNADYRNTLGVAHYRNGDFKATIAELETAMNLRAGGNSFDWLFLAMAHWQLGDYEKARSYFNRAAQWMDKYDPPDEELRRFRAEAKTLLAEPRKR
jgi:tetratricopeptide (TPR) repeat protein